MKIDCSIIKDILPLYVEEMVSEKSKELIEEHLVGCESCQQVYKEMKEPVFQAQLKTNPAESFQKYAKKTKRHMEWKGALIAAAVVLGLVFARLFMIGGLVGFLALDSAEAEVEINLDVNYYNQYIGAEAKKEYRNKWGMDESIFPEKITSGMTVEDYKMVYYNPWDAQYLSYLVVEYDDESYASELKRLENYSSTEYKGYYGAGGFDEKYELLAMNADSYHGFVYALSGGKNKIIYVEIIFCNYFLDIDYKEYIKEDYLPVGFDASKDNAYRKQMVSE